MRRLPEPTRPDPLELLRRARAEGRRRAILRVYLGYARGCGSSTAMLEEGHRRRSRGTDVVVGARCSRPAPGSPREELEQVCIESGPTGNCRLDPAAVLARNPDVVCVDDLVELDVNGNPVIDSVPGFLAAGITVLATLHMRSTAAGAIIVAGTSSAAGGPSLSDAQLALIDELEIVDLPPGELMERIRAGAILTPAETARGLQAELRPAVLGALRESALRLIADHSDRQLGSYLEASGPTSPHEFRSRVVLCLSIRAGLESRIGVAARIAAAQDAAFTVVTVRSRPLSSEAAGWLGAYAAQAHRLKGELVRLEGRQVAPALARYVIESQATEVILGHRSSRWRPWDTTSELIRRLSGVDVHILSTAGTA